MKSFTKILVMGAAFAAASPLAFADTITAGSSFTLSGNDTYTSSVINFGPSQLGAAGDTGTTEITGTFANYLTDGTAAQGGSTVTFVTPLPYSQGFQTVPGSTPIFSVTGSGETFSFDVSSYEATYSVSMFDPNSTTLTINGIGDFVGTGVASYDASPAEFSFSSQVVNGNTNTTFSASTSALGSAVTPEPNSLLLLGTGLIGGAGLLFMRRRSADTIA